ncbi:MAG: twin-arginine translocase TatA/TatE family subunit [Moraxellaceae bacterium]|nr:MAG: twin-arginine translocase TatA/TatE family subunit [Moraxellaceae bacterium]
MAAGNFGSPMQLLILLAIVLLLFGGKRLRNLGGDLGGAIKGFKNSMASSDASKDGVSGEGKIDNIHYEPQIRHDVKLESNTSTENHR